MENPYLGLTNAFNAGRLRAILSSGQAVVMHRLAVMSKDGDWILREDEDATRHVLGVLAERGARYRFGAPLDVRWLSGGWSSHLELRAEGLRLRTDFVSRPPRLDATRLAEVWAHAERECSAVLPLEPLAAIKLTDREKDYVVVGELARRMSDPRAQLLYARSSRDLIALAARHGELIDQLAEQRPLLLLIPERRDVLEEALDRERRQLMRANEERLDRYRQAYRPWTAIWPDVQRAIAGLPLAKAHEIVVARAQDVLPRAPSGGAP